MTSRISSAITTTAAIIAIIAGLYTLYSGLKDGSPSLEAKVVSIEDLTETIRASGIGAEITVSDQKVQSLWEIRISIRNNGEKTIIGVGERKDLIDRGLKITLPKGYRISAAVNEKSDPEVSLNTVAETVLEVSFDQWKPSEKSHIRMYASGPQYLQEAPIPTINERALIGGTIETSITRTGSGDIVDIPDHKIKIKKNTYDAWLTVFGFFSVFSVVIIGAAGVAAPLEYLRVRQWRQKHGKAFRRYISELDLDQVKDHVYRESKEQWISNPYHTPEYIWNEFSGERIKTELLTTTPIGSLVLSTSSILVVISFLVISFCAPV
jgi:hypothetical protein